LDYVFSGFSFRGGVQINENLDVVHGCIFKRNFCVNATLKPEASASRSHPFQVSDWFTIWGGVVDFKEAGDCAWRKGFSGLGQWFRLFFLFLF
jgi:hypothetical protein